jgi:gliding motility-associated-like protein
MKRFIQAFALLLIVTSSEASYAQAPNITYASNTQVYSTGTAIAPLKATNTGGTTPAAAYGQVTTFAGSGAYGNTDGLGTAASFGQATGIAIDGNGNLYISDPAFNNIRKITPAGQVSVFAGSSSGEAGSINGTGINARFNAPAGIAIDVNGTLYVAEAGNNRIRRITATGVVTNYSGTGLAGAANTASGVAATFNNPTGIAIDASGSLYVVDRGNNLIRKIATSGVVSTFAGSGAAGKVNATGTAASFSGPSGLAIDGAGNLYVTDTNNGIIRKISPLGEVTTFAGAGNSFETVDGTAANARFYLPRYITIDSFGDLFVSESNVIRKITPSAVVTTLAGSNGLQYSTDGIGVAAGFGSPWAMAFDSQRNLFVADFYAIRKINTAGYTISPGLPAGLSLNPYNGEISGTALSVSPAINYNVTAINSAGRSIASLIISTRIPVSPNVAAFSPAIATAGSTINIKGEHLTGTSAVSFGGVPARSFVVRSDTVLQAVVDIGNSGNVVVTRPSGAITLPGFTYTAAPNVSYQTPQTYTVGTPISALVPANPGGTIPPTVPFPGVSLYASIGPTVSGSYAGLGGITADVYGNLFVADVSHNLIKRISPTGSVITFAGSGVAGSANGTGVTANFNNISGVTSDVSGNLYVVEAGNNLVRKITPAGLVSTLAGSGSAGKVNGVGTAASFNNPRGITIDGSGNIYIGDVGNNLVRKITPEGVVSTLAGSGTSGAANGQGVAASINGINAITTDNAGNIFIAEYGNHLIRKINPGGMVTTFAGSGAVGTVDGVGTAASFRYPNGLTSDAFGNIYVSDDTTDGVRRITPSGAVTTLPMRLSFADLSSSIYNNMPHGLTFDANGNLYTTGQNQVIKVSIGGYELRLGNGTGAGVIAPGLVFDEKTGVLTGTPSAPLAATTYNITAHNLAGSSATTLTLTVNAAPVVLQVPNISYTTPQTFTAGTPITPLTPANSGGDVPDGFYGQAVTYAGHAIAQTNEDGTEIHIGLRYPTGIALDAAGNMYVANYDNNVISKVTPDGVLSTFAGSGAVGSTNGKGTAATFKAPAGVAVDAAGNVYVADTNNNLIRKITPAGQVSTFAGSGAKGSANGQGIAASFYAPSGITIDAAGNLYVTDNLSLIRKITPARQVSTLAGSLTPGSANGQGTAASFNLVAGIAVDAAGNLYVCDMLNNLIRKITPAGVVTTIAGSGAAGNANGTGTAASFDHPFGIAVGADGNIFVADSWNRRVRKITPAGVVSTLVSSGFSDNIQAIVIDAAGNIYVTDGTGLNSYIRKIAATGYAISPALPAGLDIDGQGRIVGTPTAISPATSYAITAYNTAGSSSTTINITVNEAPPVVLQAPNIIYTTSQTYIAGTAIADLSPSNTGGEVPETLYGLVSTLAGSGAQGGANGTGTAASFYTPNGVAADAVGNVYVADEVNRLIRKISPAGEVTTFAGSGTYGNADGTGTAASFTQPGSLTIDADGNVYVADRNSNLIRKITPAGAVTTLAGSGAQGNTNGIGTAASFKTPAGVAVDADGNVYVADNGNQLIRKITPAGAVTTLAGSGNNGSANGTGTAASFNNPSGIAVDASGNVYVADVANNLIRKITPAGVVSSYAGKTGISGAADGSAATATFTSPHGVAVDATGNVYVSDFNNLIRKISPGGTVSTLAGSGTAGYADGPGAAASFYQPNGITVGADGNIYVADTYNQRIRKVTATGYSISPALPAGLTLNGQGRITGTPVTATPATSYNITAYNAAGSSTTTISFFINADPNAPPVNPVPAPVISYTGPQIYAAGAAITPLAATNTGGQVPPNFYKQVSTLAGSGVSGATDGTGTAAKFYYPSGTALDTSGNIYVADSENHLIRKITPAGKVTTFAGVGGEFSRPTGLAVSADGYIYVADMGSHRILKVSPAGVVSTMAGSGEADFADGIGATASFNEPRGITIDATGNLYVADAGNCRIRKITPAGQVTTLAGSGEYSYQDGNGTGASFFYPTALTIGSGGNIYVADTYNYRIRKVTPAGQVTTLAGSGEEGMSDGTTIAASFKLPGGLTADAGGNLYVADTENHLIRMVTPTGKVTTLAGTGNPGNTNGTGTLASFNALAGLAAGADGNIYVADAANNLIRKVAATGYTITPALPAGLRLDVNGKVSGTPTAISPATTYTITAYNAGGSSAATISIAVANSLVFAAIPAKTYGTADFSPGATAGSSAIVYTSSNTAVATIVSGKIHLAGVGTSTITATSDGKSLTQTLTVNPATLTITAADKSKIYGSANPGLTVTYSGFKNNETSTLVTTKPVLTTTAATTSGVGTYPITASGAVAANYTIVYAAGTLTVTPAALTITAADKSKTYGYSNPGLTATYSGFKNSETSAVVTTKPAAATTAITTSVVGTYPITVSGAAAANYTITYVAGTLTVNPATLTITAADKSKIYGSANPGLTITYSGFKNSETSAVLITKPSAATTATATSGVGIYPITASGAVAANYIFAYTSGTLTVGQANLVIMADNKSKDYGLANPMLTATYSGFVNGETAASLTTQPTITTTATTISTAGTYPVTVGGAASPNYAISYVAGALTIRDVAISFNPIASQGYGAADFTPGATGGAITYSSSNTAVATIVSGKVHIVGVGTTTVTASNGLSTATQTITVNKAILTITADSQSKTYGSGNPALTATYSGFVNGETAASLAAQPTLTTAATTTSGAGTYPITVSGATAANYTITYAAGTLTVNPATLTVTAANKSKTYGSASPALTLTYSGFRNNETSAVLTTKPALATTATTTSGVGTYPITASGAVAANYTINYTTGTLTISPADLLAEANDASRSYGSANPVFTLAYTGFVNGDAAATAFTDLPKASTAATATSPAGGYAITVSGGLARNYSISYGDGLLTVEKASLLISAENKTKTYGLANPALTVSYTGFKNGESATVLSTNPSISTTATNTSRVGTYPVTVKGASANNYNITYAAGILTITPATLTVTSANKSKIYGAANPALTAIYTGFVNGETSAVITTKPTITTSATNASGVGNYPVTASGAVASNYTIAYAAGTLSISPAELLVEAGAASRSYGSSNPVFALTYTGFVNGDGAATAFTALPKAITAAVATSPVGSYAIAVSGGVAPNYSISYGEGLLTVAKASLKITAANKAKAYGSVNPVLTVSYSGFKNGESETVLITRPGISTTATVSSSVGAYPITVKGATAANYTITYVAGTLMADKAALIITVESKSKTYGSENPVLTATYSGFVNNEYESTLTVQPTLSTTATTASPVGTHPIAASGASATNYAITYAAGTLTIDPAELLAEAGDAGRIYGSANPAFALTYTGFVNGEDAATAFTALPNASTTATATAPAGGYAIVVSGGVAPNYSIRYGDGLLMVAKAPLKITAENKTKAYGSANPALTVSYSGFKNGEAAAVLSTKVSISTTATTLSPVGTYPITAKGASGNNYTISYVAGTLAVTQALPPPILEPVISYASPIFTKSVAIAPLKPANTGGVVPATAYGQVITLAGSSLSGSADGVATAAKFKSPSGAAFDHAGNLFIADIGGHVIRKISPDGTVITFAGNGTAGAVNATGTAAKFSYPCGVAIDANDNLYITDRNNQLIRKVTPAGVVTTYAGTGAIGSANGNRTAATFGSPTGITIDAAGNLYITDSSTGLIRKITPAGIVSTLAGGGVAGSADGVGAAASFTDPRGIAVDSTGIVYVSEYSSHRIRKINPSGVVTTYAGTGTGGLTNGDTTNASFLNPAGLAVDRLNNLYVADYGNSLIRKITPGGVVSTMAGKANSSVNVTDAVGTGATFYQPYALTIDGGGSLFVADYGSHRIRKVLTKGYALNSLPALPAGLSFDATTGTFSGTPTAVLAATAYTVTAYNNYGSSNATFTLAVSTPPTLAASPVKTIDIPVVKRGNKNDADAETPEPKLNPALSPNSDGVNDVLRINNIEMYPDNRVTLMDKGGRSVYEVSGYDNSNKVFDGHAGKNGVMLAPGTYFYMIEYNINGKLKRKTGYFIMKY